MMSGRDVSPLGSDVVTQIHQLFSWVAKSPKGVIIFIDEAECYLGSNNEALNSVSRCTKSLVYTYHQAICTMVS
jgi:ATPase family AAA domain-containing protein 3A/B